MYYEIKTKSSTFFYTTQKKYMQKLLKPSQNSSSDCIGFSGYIHFAAKSPEIIIHMTYQSMSSLLISCQRSFLFAGSQWHTCDQKLYCTTHLYDPCKTKLLCEKEIHCTKTIYCSYINIKHIL